MEKCSGSVTIAPFTEPLAMTDVPLRTPLPARSTPAPGFMPAAWRPLFTHGTRGACALRAMLFLALVACCGAQAQELRFEPIDQNAEDLGWLNYRNRLVDALEARDRSALLAAIDPDVYNGPDQKRGIAEFRRRWAFDDDASPMWNELRKAVSLGGAYVKDEKGATRFCAPYVAAKWPTTIDPFGFGAIVSPDVLVKAEPSSESRTLAVLTYDVVKVQDWEVPDRTPGFPQKWTRIEIRGKPGFVPEQQIRSPIEHMACFAAPGGAWRLVSFTAGYLPE
jgi:hypothetical protein